MKTPPVKLEISLLDEPNLKGMVYRHPALPEIKAEVIQVWEGEFDCFFYKGDKMLPSTARPLKSWGDGNTTKEEASKVAREFLHAEAKKPEGARSWDTVTVGEPQAAASTEGEEGEGKTATVEEHFRELVANQ